ncbi:MAG: HAD family phosphatase [Candidatus Alcyoniella australis]|nr:HAD family phosphatase [Candidatus Alcyoniella australis]
MKLRAVLWDMDGVLIDSMDRHAQAWIRAAGELGLNEIDPQEILRREGERGEVSARDFIKAHDMMPTRKRVRQLLETKEQIFAAMGPARPFPNIEQVLAEVARRGLAMALVTGTSADELETVLPAPIRSMFKVLITGDAVLHGKPNPEPYLKAAMGLGLAPEVCLAVENAPFGLRSAKDAGALVAVVPTSLPIDQLPGADFYLDSIEQVPGLLDRIAQTD